MADDLTGLAAINTETAVIRIPGALTVAADGAVFVAPYDIEIVRITLGLGTVATGASVIADLQSAAAVDVHTLTIPVSTESVTFGDTVGTPIEAGSVAAGTVLDLDVTQIGSGVAGSDAILAIEYRKIS